MKYITGQHALNLNCSLDTCGDWHQSALQWVKLNIRETENSIFGEYGIEISEGVPENTGQHYIANTLRALLDLLEEGNFGIAQGAREELICNEAYTQEFLSHVYELRCLQHWKKIALFMEREYTWEWRNFLISKGENVEELLTHDGTLDWRYFVISEDEKH